jgi:hypothetical protein
MRRVQVGLPQGPTEQITWKSRAARPLGAVNVIGTLYLTETRLVFVTSRLKNLKIRSCITAFSLKDLESAGRQARTNRIDHAGLRTQLRLDLEDRTSILFVVRHVDEVVARLNLAIQAAKSKHT